MTTKIELTVRIVFLTIFFITLASLFIRIQYIQKTEIYNPIRADARQYVIYAHNLLNHGTFSQELAADKPPTPDSFRSPGYPLFLALSFLLGGKSGFYATAIYLQVLLSALLVPLTYFTGRPFLSKPMASIAAIFVAISPHLIAMTSYLLTETIYSLLLLLSTYLFNLSLRKRNILYYLLSGLIAGYTYLTNETYLFLPYIFILFALFFIDWKNNKKMLLNLAIYIAVFTIFPTFWILRNSNLPADSPKSTNRAIKSMTHGAYPGFIYKNKEFKYYPYKEDPQQPFFSSSFNNFAEVLAGRIKERPIRYLSWYLFEKPYYLWSWNNLQSRMGEENPKGTGDVYVYTVKTSLYFTSEIANLTRKFMKLIHPVVLVLTLIGICHFIWLICRTKTSITIFNSPFLIGFVITYYTLLFMVFAPWPRYSVPLRPELYIISLWSFTIIIDYVKKYLKGK